MIFYCKTIRILTCFGVLFFTGCCSNPTPLPDDPNFTPKAIFIHINDTYRVDAVSNGNEGGLSRVATIVKNLKASTEVPVTILHGGDFLSPSLETNYFNGQQMVDALNFLNDITPLIVVPGNHEFDFDDDLKGIKKFAEAFKNSKFTWLGTNLILQNIGDNQVDGKLSKQLALPYGDIKVGFFGVSVGKGRNYVQTDKDYARVAKEALQSMKSETDFVVGLTHLDIKDDVRLAALRKGFPNFVWIAGGHEHECHLRKLTNQSALVTKGASNARSIWKVTLGYDQNGKPAVKEKKIRLDQTIMPDPEYVKKIEDPNKLKLIAEIPYLDKKIGSTTEMLDCREETIRNQETNWGNYITDVMRTAFDVPKADIALLSSGTLRLDDQFTGDITFEHLLRSIGFKTPVYYIPLKGKHVVEALENSVSQDKRGDGRFLQVSGIKFTFSKKALVGNRVKDVEIKIGTLWEEIDPDKEYIVAISDFMFKPANNDGYKFNCRADGKVVCSGPELKWLIMAAVSNSGKINPQVDSTDLRIKELNAVVKDCY